MRAHGESDAPGRAEDGDTQQHSAVSQPVAQERHEKGSGRRAGEPHAHDDADGSGIESQLGEIDTEEHADEPGGHRSRERGDVDEVPVAQGRRAGWIRRWQLLGESSSQW